LRDITTVTLDRLYHQLERRVDDGTGFFWVEVFYQIIDPLMSRTVR
jgi:hypothetical protein